LNKRNRDELRLEPKVAPEEAKVRPLFSKDLPDFPGKEGLMITVEYPPGASDPVYRHNADAFVYVLEGSIVMQVIARGHRKDVRVIGTTNPPFENSFFEGLVAAFYTSEREAIRQKVNDWFRSSGEFDGVVDLDAVLRDPSHPTQLLPEYDSGDHLHPNDSGCLAEGNSIPLALFAR
jgi:hypothetical protein